MNVRVEYEATPIRHIAVQCPKCESWFKGRDITDMILEDDSDLYFAQFICPVCDKVFGADEYNNYATMNIEEVDYPKIYEGCLEKTEVWE